jgi:hypothetical protein
LKGDFSRDSYDRQRAFSRVLMQQGRVSLDADWNEQSALMLAQSRALAADLLGRGAGPDHCCGFEIRTVKGDILLLPGRYYVGGIAVELGAGMLYSAQPGYPFDDATRIEAFHDKDGWLAYLDVWEEFVSADQDESLREPALRGPDTSGRAQVRWQVRVLPGAGDGLEQFEALASRVSGRLTVSVRAGGSPAESAAGYRGAGNCLYRVEIHRGTDAAGNGATFKWSRDNGSITFPVLSLDGSQARVEGLERDERHALRPGTWLELVDESWTGRDPGGPLGRVAEVKPDDGAVILDWAGRPPVLPEQPARADGLRPVLRQWDHPGVAQEDGAIALDASRDIALEHGLVIAFEQGAHYRPGEHWLIPARPGIGCGIIWPGAPDQPAAQRPHGPDHFYAPLALCRHGKVHDLRHRFKAISEPFMAFENAARLGRGRHRSARDDRA